MVAISFQLNQDTREIHLTIAENSDVSVKLVKHLTDVWEMLRQLSEAYAAHRGEALDQDYRSKSPTVPKGVAKDLRLQIFRKIYQLPFRKQMRRVAKRWDRLERLVNQ